MTGYSDRMCRWCPITDVVKIVFGAMTASEWCAYLQDRCRVRA